MALKKDYSYIKPGYIFPVSNIECASYEWEVRDAPTAAKPRGQLRHWCKVICPFCKIIFDERIDRLEFNPEKADGPRTWCCPTCAKIHKRSWKDPWRNSEGNKAEKQEINLNRVENLEGKIIGQITVGPANEGYTDRFGLAWWPCKCSCGEFEFIRGNTLRANKKCACKKCLGSISSGERVIIDWLKQYNIKYTTQDTFNDLRGINNGLLRFDVSIRNNKNEIMYFIEFQGKEHYEPINFFNGEEGFKIRQEHDNRKREWCKQNNIPLIEIPYNYKNIEDYLTPILKEST